MVRGLLLPLSIRSLCGIGAAALLGVGCSLGEAGDDAIPDGGVCASTWGALDAGTAVFVNSRGGSDEEGDGSYENPLASLGAGQRARREGGIPTLALFPGDYSATTDDKYTTLFGDLGDSNSSLVGCGVDATNLVAIEAARDPGFPDDISLQPGLVLAGPLDGVRVAHLTIQGGSRGLIIRDGAGSGDPVVVEQVRIEDALHSGLLVSGLDTRATFLDVDVEGTDSEEVSPLGYGMLIQGGGSTWEPPVGEVLITGGSVTSARRAGVVVDKTRIAFEGLTVQSTRASLGALGRGIQLQNSVEGSLDAVDVRDNNESGLFVLKPLDVTIRNSVFADTRAGFVFGQAEDVAGGDGLCVTFGEGDPDPTAYRLVLEANTFQENSRVGALAEGVAVVLGDGNVFTGNFLPDETTFPLGDTLFVQHSATVTGPGGEDVVDQVGDLGATSGVELLEVYRGSLDLDSDEEVPN